MEAPVRKQVVLLKHTAYFQKTPNNTWKLVDYYIRLDWAWAKYMVESHVPACGKNVAAKGHQLVGRSIDDPTVYSTTKES
jgi:hypothetical protein